MATNKKGFLSDGVSVRDFEKLATGIAFLLSVAVILVLAVWRQFVDGTLCLYSSGLGTLFVIRKIAKYNLVDGKTVTVEEEATEDTRTTT